jgi:hypothetical protein
LMELRNFAIEGGICGLTSCPLSEADKDPIGLAFLVIRFLGTLAFNSSLSLIIGNSIPVIVITHPLDI